jgi:hypothetical protein
VRRAASVAGWRARVACAALLTCIACRRSGAQQALDITIHRPAIELSAGDTTTVRAVVTAANAKAPSTVEWTSDNNDVARVNAKGLVTALSPGVTGITARIGTAFATTRVTVSPAERSSAARTVAATRAAPTAPAARPAAAPAARPAATRAAAPAAARRSGRMAAPMARRSPRSPHFSHISLFYTDFYSQWASPGDRTATIGFLGSRLDGVMSGPRELWKSANPSILYFPYTLQYTVVQPTGTKDDRTSAYLKDMQRWYSAHRQYDMEKAFLHVGGLDAAHRVELKIWDSKRWVINPGDAGSRAYQRDRYQRIAEGAEGVFIDEFGGKMGGAKPSDEYPTTAAYLAAEAEMIAAIHAAIAPKILLINIAEYWSPADSAIVVAGGGAHLERTNFPFTDRLIERWTQIDHLLAMNVYTEFVTLWGYTDWVSGRGHFQSFTRGIYDSEVERGQLFQLASYYMAVPANPQRFSYDQQNMWNVRPDTVWMPAVEADVGHPREKRRLLASGLDAAGQKYRIYARDFDHAYVVIRPQTGWRNQTYADSTGIAVTLPAPMRLLHRDGTLGAAVSSVTLRNVESAILFK